MLYVWDSLDYTSNMWLLHEELATINGKAVNIYIISFDECCKNEIFVWLRIRNKPRDGYMYHFCPSNRSTGGSRSARMNTYNICILYCTRCTVLCWAQLGQKPIRPASVPGTKVGIMADDFTILSLTIRFIGGSCQGTSKPPAPPLEKCMPPPPLDEGPILKVWQKTKTFVI